MADVPARFKVDLREVRGAFGEIRKLSGSVGGGQFAGVTRSVQATNRELAASPGFVSRFSQSIGRAAKVAAGLSAITVALVILNRRFPAIGQVANQAFSAITKGSSAAVSTTARMVATLANLRVAIGLAAGIFTLARAFRALRTETTNLPAPKLPGTGGGAFAGGFLGSMIGPIVSSIPRRIAAAGMAGLMAAGTFEQTEISFEVMTGGLAPAQKLLGDIRDMAAKTPFTLPGLADAGKTLLAFGVTADQVPGKLKMLGDIAGGNQQKLESAALVFGQITSAGRLMGQDLLQLVNLGFNPLQEIAARTGESMVDLKKRMEDGGISAGEVESAFVAATSAGGRFFDMTNRQSQTFLGLLSTLSDAMEASRRAFATPVMAALKPAIAALTEFFEKGEARAAAFGERVAQGLDFIRAVFRTMSAGEIFLGVGKALQYGVQVAVDLLVRGVQTVIGLLGDTNFMSEIGKGLEMAALRFKEILLLAASDIVKGFEGILPAAKVENAANFLKASADVAAAEREALAAEQGRPVVDLLEKVKGEFADARGIFGTSANDSFFGEVQAIFAKASEEAAKLTAERMKKPKPAAGEVEKPSREGLIPAGGGGGTVSGAFQRAINLIQGRTVNELVAQEARKTNELLGMMSKAAKDTSVATQETARKVGKTPKVEVKVVPTFA